MKALRLDFIQAKPDRAYLAVLLVSVPLLLSAIHDRSKLINEIDKYEEQISYLDAEINNINKRTTSLNAEPEELKAIKSMISTPWDVTIGALQHAAGNDVVLDKLQSMGTNQVVVSGRAPTSEVFVSYLGRLEKTDAFKEVIPISQQQDVLSRGPNAAAITFEIALVWK